MYMVRDSLNLLFLFSQVNEVLWNIDSTVLMVWGEDLQDGPSKQSYGIHLLFLDLYQMTKI